MRAKHANIMRSDSIYCSLCLHIINSNDSGNKETFSFDKLQSHQKGNYSAWASNVPHLTREKLSMILERKTNFSERKAFIEARK